MNRSRKDVAMMAVMGVLLLFAAYNFAFKPQQSESVSKGGICSLLSLEGVSTTTP